MLSKKENKLISKIRSITKSGCYFNRLGDSILYMIQKPVKNIWEHKIVKYSCTIADYDIIVNNENRNDLKGTTTNLDLFDRNYDDGIVITGSCKKKESNTHYPDPLNGILYNGTTVSNLATSISKGITSNPWVLQNLKIESDYNTDKIINMDDMTERFNNKFNISLHDIIGEFNDKWDSITNSSNNFINETQAEGLTADFYVRKIGDNYSLFISNDIMQKVVRKLVEIFAGDDNVGVKEGMINALTTQYDNLVDDLIRKEPKYSVTMTILKDPLKNILIKIANSIDNDSGLINTDSNGTPSIEDGTGYNIDNNTTADLYKQSIAYHSLKNILCSFRLTFFDLIHRDCLNTVFNMFMTQFRYTIDNNSDFLYFDYSNFDFSQNNRYKYKNIVKSSSSFGANSAFLSYFNPNIANTFKSLSV